MTPLDQLWLAIKGLESAGMPPVPRLTIDWFSVEEPMQAPLCRLEHDDEALCDPDSREDDISQGWHDIPVPKSGRKYRAPVSNRQAFIHTDTALVLISHHVLTWIMAACRARSIELSFADSGVGATRYTFHHTHNNKAAGTGPALPLAALDAICNLEAAGLWDRS